MQNNSRILTRSATAERAQLDPPHSCEEKVLWKQIINVAPLIAASAEPRPRCDNVNQVIII